MRRLYSTFAGGWPGTGLLLLRVVGGSTVLAGAGATLTSTVPVHTAAAAVLLGACGLLLIPGLWTPIAGTLAAFIQMVQVLTDAADPRLALLVTAVTAALAMLGPGLWSIDARLFGWKRVEARPRSTRTPRG